MIVTDDVLGEVQSSKFNDAYILEAYLNNFEGYAKGSDIMSKFGINLQNEITLTVSRKIRRFYCSFRCYSQRENSRYRYHLWRKTQGRRSNLFPTGRKIV